MDSNELKLEKGKQISKLYIPVIVKQKIGRGVTLVSADRISILKSIMPKEKEVFEHLSNVSNKKDPYSTFKILIHDELFDDLVTLIRFKVPKSKYNPISIDLVMDLKTLPIIQILRRSSNGL